MRDVADVYDLGQATVAPLGLPRGRTAPRVDRPSHSAPARRFLPGQRIRASLSLLVPGSGQLLAGRADLAIFFATAIGFLAAFCWALIETFDRLSPMLELLGIPVAVPLGTLAAAYLLAASLHVSCVVEASGGGPSGRPVSPHPVVAAGASALVPGWGQLLNGDRARGAMFLASVWVVAGIWIVGSPAATQFFNTYVSAVPAWEQALRGPVFAWTAGRTVPALIWGLAVYDAASSAAHRR